MISKIVKKIKVLLSKPLELFKKLSFKKKVLTVVSIIIAFAIINAQIANLTKKDPFTVEKVIKTNITESVVEAGNVNSNGRSDIYSPTDGIITEVLISNGSYVEKGDLLFTVKSTATEQERQAAYSNYLAAASTLNAAQSTANALRADMYAKWDAFRELATNGTYENGDDTPNRDNRLAAEFQITQDLWLATEKKYKDQTTAIAQAQASVASTHALYQAKIDAKVTAPIDGTVSNISVSPGASVSIKSIGLTGTTSPPALILTQNSIPEVKVLLSETDVIKVKPGQKAKVTVGALKNKSFNASVNRVDSVGTDTQGVISFAAYLQLMGTDPNLRPGMTVDASIITNEIKNVLSVPNSAVKPYQGGRAVRVPDPQAKEKFKYVPVEIGIKGTQHTQIIKGLSEGQVVITTLDNESLKRSGVFGN